MLPTPLLGKLWGIHQASPSPHGLNTHGQTRDISHNQTLARNWLPRNLIPNTNRGWCQVDDGPQNLINSFVGLSQPSCSPANPILVGRGLDGYDNGPTWYLRNATDEWKLQNMLANWTMWEKTKNSWPTNIGKWRKNGMRSKQLSYAALWSRQQVPDSRSWPERDNRRYAQAQK